MLRASLSIVTVVSLGFGASLATATDDAKEKPLIATLEVKSSAFTPGGAIPRKYTKEGDDVSPPLQWTGAPAVTKEIAVIMDDPDAPRANAFVHWVAYKIAGDSRGLEEGTKSAFVAGKNHFGELAYGGPMPPPGHGVHHYHFKVYALDAPLAAEPGMAKEALLRAMEGHIVATGEVVGTYERK